VAKDTLNNLYTRLPERPVWTRRLEWTASRPFLRSRLALLELTKAPIFNAAKFYIFFINQAIKLFAD